MTQQTRHISPLPIDTVTGAVSLDYASTRLGRGVRNFWKALRNRFAAHALAEMSDYQLADIGLTRHDVTESLAQEVALDPTLELARRARINTRYVRA